MIWVQFLLQNLGRDLDSELSQRCTWLACMLKERYSVSFYLMFMQEQTLTNVFKTFALFDIWGPLFSHIKTFYNLLYLNILNMYHLHFLEPSLPSMYVMSSHTTLHPPKRKHSKLQQNKFHLMIIDRYSAVSSLRPKGTYWEIQRYEGRSRMCLKNGGCFVTV